MSIDKCQIRLIDVNDAMRLKSLMKKIERYKRYFTGRKDEVLDVTSVQRRTFSEDEHDDFDTTRDAFVKISSMLETFDHNSEIITSACNNIINIYNKYNG